jgi:hypothetical protein
MVCEEEVVPIDRADQDAPVRSREHGSTEHGGKVLSEPLGRPSVAPRGQPACFLRGRGG